MYDPRVALGPNEPAPDEQAHALAVAPHHEAAAIVLDLIGPRGAGRRHVLLRRLLEAVKENLGGSKDPTIKRSHVKCVQVRERRRW